MFYNAKQRKLRLRDTEFDYITFGRGTKSLVMIQGLNTRGIQGAAVSLAYMYRIFAKDFRVYLFDRRVDVKEGITVRDMAADIAMAMDALEIKNAAVLGVSQGGMIAQYLAIDRPDLVSRLVLAVTLCRNNDTVEAVIRNWVHLTESGDIKGLVMDMAEKMYSESYLKRYRPLLPLLTLVQKPKDAQRFMILAKACLTCNTYDQLDRITCPVLVIGGAKDQIVTGGACVELADKLGCQPRLYKDLGHAAYEEAPDFNQSVYDFFTQ